MESAILELFQTILKDTSIDANKLLETHKDSISKFVSEFEDPDLSIRCLGKNKNGKRCSKPRKENLEFCAIHSNQQKEKDIDFVFTDSIINKDKEKDTKDKPKETSGNSSKSIQILENTKKKGVLPEKIKKITYESKKYYINKNDWVYEMDQTTEQILSDIPIGKLFTGKLIQLKID